MKRFFMLTAIVLLLAVSTFNIFAEPVLMGARAFSAEASSSASENYDFSVFGDTGALMLAPSELLRAFTGGEISDGEALFVDKESTISFSYSSSISTDSVRVRYPNGSESIYILARAYTAENTNNGISVVWIPKSAAVGGQSAEFSEGEGDFPYRAELAFDGEERFSVTYEASFSFSEEAVNELSALAYNSALAAVENIKNENEKYEKLLAEYQDRCENYPKYIKELAIYEAELSAYEKYIAELADYNVLKEEHDEAMLVYERLYDEYEARVSAMEKYEDDCNAYYSYLEELERYEKDKAAYNEYLQAAEKYLTQLNIIDTAKIPMTDKRTLYGAVMGGTVTSAIENAGEIAGNIPNGKDAVADAKAATQKIRAFFEIYFACTTDEARYSCYSLHYSTKFGSKRIVEAFSTLLRSLDYLFSVDVVYDGLAMQDKSKKYVILLAQLYIIADALSAEPIYNYTGTAQFTDSYTWTYKDTAGKKHTVTPIQILEGERYLSADIVSTPYTDQFPDEVAKPTVPEEKQMPTVKPDEPGLPPKKPEDLPKAPDEISEPKKPEEVLPPGDEPQAYVPSDEELLLKNGLESGELSKRELHKGEFLLKRTSSLDADVSRKDGATVYFYSDIGEEEPVFTDDVGMGESAVFEGEAPKKPSDESYHYSFAGWQYENGAPADLENIGTGHVYLYPAYEKHDKNETFTVTWHVAGKTFTSYVKYGEKPSFPGVPTREKDELYYYEFASWDRPIEPAYSDVEYTASFTKIRYYKITWLLGTETYAEGDCLEGELPVPPSTSPTLPDDSYGRYSFSGWGELLPADSDASYEAKFDVTRYYTIEWRFNGELLESTRCLETEIPTAPIPLGTVLLDDGSVRLTLEGWEGELSAPVSDSSYEAVFSTLHYYTASWVFGDTEYKSVSLLEGSVPSYDGNVPTRVNDLMYKYSFSGWDKEFLPISGDTVFSAQFSAEYIFPCQDSGAEIAYSYGRLTATLPSGAFWLENFALLAELAGERQLTVKTEIGSVDIPSEALALMKDGGVFKLCFGDALGEYSVTALDKDGKPVLTELSLSASFPLKELPKPSSGGTVQLAIREGGAFKPVSVSVQNDIFYVSSFKLNNIYKYVEFFKITIAQGRDFLTASALAAEGEEILIEWSLPEGVLLSEIYYTSEANPTEKIPVSGESFLMPSENIRLSLVTVPRVFTVKFVIFGYAEIIRKCEWGSMPKAPEVPKGADDEYFYSFTAWDKELSPVYSDEVYTAQYEKTPIPVIPEAKRNLLLSFVAAAYPYRVVLIVSTALAILSVPALIFFKKYRKNHPFS